MDRTVLAKMYGDAVQGDTIDVATLLKVPELVTCQDWHSVEILGNVDYVSERTKVAYNGMLVKQGGGLYYIRKKLAEALGDIDRRFKNVKKQIRTI